MARLTRPHGDPAVAPPPAEETRVAPPGTAPADGATAPAARTPITERVRERVPHRHHEHHEHHTGGVLAREQAREMRARQREEFGGINWGSAFFGWLVAIGLGALLTGALSAAGAGLGLSDSSAETIGIVGGVLLALALAVAYFAGGYVAGRMSRFDGARQGFAVWLVGLVATIVIGGLGALLGSNYNVLARLDLPRIPIDEGTLTTGGLIALAVAILLPLVAAIAGGKAGERFHRKIDRSVVD